jgi:mRNA-degrading endonuclease RelE of RelBE toxin-antitoxin system
VPLKERTDRARARPLDFRACMYNNTCVFEIRFEETVEEELAALRPHEGRRILDVIEEQLRHEPDVATRHRKILEGAKPPLNVVPPVWQLRVGEYRVLYDVSREEMQVNVRAVRRKPPHKTTEEIL